MSQVFDDKMFEKMLFTLIFENWFWCNKIFKSGLLIREKFLLEIEQIGFKKLRILCLLLNYKYAFSNKMPPQKVEMKKETVKFIYLKAICEFYFIFLGGGILSSRHIL